MAGANNSRSKTDVEVTTPDGRTYRISTRRRGDSMRHWDGVETGFGPLDLVVFIGSLGQRLLTAARVRSQHGWTVGVLREVELRWKVVHREHFDNEGLASIRAQELARAIANGILPP